MIKLDFTRKGVYTMNMKRTNCHLTKLETDTLKTISNKSGLTVSELIRRAIDYYIEAYHAKEKV